MSTRILLADDHAIVREGVRTVLDGITDVEIVAEASTGRETLDLAKKHKPDLVIVDISMPGLNGFTVAARLQKEVPRPRVIVLSGWASEDYVRDAVDAGAMGYVLKADAVSTLAAAVEAVSRGQFYLSPSLSAPDRATVLDRTAGQTPAVDLTARERTIVALVAKGFSNEAIASQLAISVSTVQSYRNRVKDRLQISGNPELVRYAVQSGLVPPK
jgi:DNA-binding NarL/FixJ family response regulator